jgi:hypothetical protein
MKNADGASARRIAVLLVFVLVVAAAIASPVWRHRGATPSAGRPAVTASPTGPDSVPANRGDDVLDGFRGAVHPLLHGKTSLPVAAHWTSLGQGKEQLERRIPLSVYRMFINLGAAVPNRVYTEHEFSAFMPASAEQVGQVWEIDRDDVATFLRQFHPRPSLHLVARGRRAGPDGAFGLLRAVSPTHLDILFRIHAEFDIAQNVWLTPACFWGRMIIDKIAGTVEYFRLWVPTDNPLNVHLTVAESIRAGETKPVVFREIQPADRVYGKRDIVRVEKIELASDNEGLPEMLDWSDSIGMDEARLKLKRAFYAFESIDWVPWERARAVASAAHKPIFAVVLWGALDDQSC